MWTWLQAVDQGWMLLFRYQKKRRQVVGGRQSHIVLCADENG